MAGATGVGNDWKRRGGTSRIVRWARGAKVTSAVRTGCYFRSAINSRRPAFLAGWTGRGRGGAVVSSTRGAIGVADRRLVDCGFIPTAADCVVAPFHASDGGIANVAWGGVCASLAGVGRVALVAVGPAIVAGWVSGSG